MSELLSIGGCGLLLPARFSHGRHGDAMLADFRYRKKTRLRQGFAIVQPPDSIEVSGCHTIYFRSLPSPARLENG